MSIDIGWPSIAASASMPPTPQPRTPRPLIIVVCESVPTSVSGYARPRRASTNTTRARHSRLTWCTMPAREGNVAYLVHLAAVRRDDGEVVEPGEAPAQECVDLLFEARTTLSQKSE